MPTARAVIESSLRLTGVLASGESSPAAEANDALDILNDLIESLNNERLMIPELTRDTYTLTANQAAHTIGPSGSSPDLTGDRPIRIEAASLIESGEDTEHPMTILTFKQWQAIPDKTVTSAIPDYLWYETEVTIGRIHLYPVPTAAQTLVLYTWNALGTFAALTTDITFQPGYKRMLRYNLAVDLAPEYGRSVDPDVRRIALESKEVLKSQNAPMEDLRCDPAVVAGGGTWDYRTGT